MANMITFFRVILAFFSLAIIRVNPALNLTAISLIFICMLFDALDGYIARQLKTTTLQGSVFDILADRIIENIFFIFFTTTLMINIWCTFIIITRGLVIDALRSLFLSQDKTAFGQTTLHKTKWAREIACSRISRATYNIVKMLTFMCYGALLMPHSAIFSVFPLDYVQILAKVCLWLTIIMCLLRALPVLIDGWPTKRPSAILT